MKPEPTVKTPSIRSASEVAAILLGLSLLAARAEVPFAPPGTHITSWLGNTYMDADGHKNVTEELADLCLSPNGKVFTAGYAETWGGGAEYQADDGGFIARFDRFESGFGDPVKCVAADAQFVFWGTPGKGILRSAHGGGSHGSYTTFLPGNSNYGGGQPASFSVAGDYLFILYGIGHVRILNKTDGSLVGTLRQNVNGWNGSDGQVDAAYGMTVTLRKNGEYVILFENAAWANIMMTRWCPSGSCASTPQSLSLPEALLGQALQGTTRFTELRHVHITDSFWKPLLDRNRAVTIPHNLRMCREVGIVANFERVAGLRDGDYHGLPNWDEFLYKAIEAACYGLQQRPDPALEKELDALIAVLAKAQDADGYLRTVIQMSERGRGPANLKRWSNLGDNLELYCAGHLFEAGVAHFQATGKRSLLEVALKQAELIDRLFGPGKRVDVCGHQEIEPALVRLYEATGDERWWKRAKFFVDTRGTEAGGRRKRGEFSQDHAPLFEQTEAVGQAPRATYFYSGVADVGRIAGDAGYHTALRRLWEDVVTRKLYLNGGIGSRHDNEGFGPAYDLPSQTAYTEICAAVSFPMWATRMFRLEPDARYFDVIERTLYNNLAAGVSLSGNRYFYACPMESNGKFRFNLGWLPVDGKHLPHAEASATRKEWFPCACCPPTLARYLPQVPGFTYATRGNALFVNLFIAGEARVEVGGAAWSLRQEGNYTWEGKVRLTLKTAIPNPKLDTVFLRIPGWARNQPVPGDLYRFADHVADAPILAVNGERTNWNDVLTNGFARLTRDWRSGDVIELDLPMPVRRIIAHPKVADCAGKVALARGPIVYCFEGPDHDDRVLDLALPADAAFRPRLRADFLGGATVIEGELVRGKERIRATAIPYSLWSNRGAGEMAVWLKAGLAVGAYSNPTTTVATFGQVRVEQRAHRNEKQTEWMPDTDPPGRAHTMPEEKEGFLPLFAAETLTQWRQCGPGRFVVTNGIATSEGGMGLWWYAGRQFTNFVLRGEFVQEQDIADSGVFLRFPNPGNDPWVAVHKGHEMEIGDPLPQDPTWRTGSIYPFAASSRANTKPLGQWNTFEITCNGQDYHVRINEEMVTNWTDPRARASHGFIGLQNYNDNKVVRHRNLRIKALP